MKYKKTDILSHIQEEIKEAKRNSHKERVNFLKEILKDIKLDSLGPVTREILN